MEQIALSWEPERRYFTVSELAQALRGAVAEFSDIWVSGEISGAKLPASGHYYFTLKDDASQISARFEPGCGCLDGCLEMFLQRFAECLRYGSQRRCSRIPKTLRIGFG